MALEGSWGPEDNHLSCLLLYLPAWLHFQLLQTSLPHVTSSVPSKAFHLLSPCLHDSHPSRTEKSCLFQGHPPDHSSPSGLLIRPPRRTEATPCFHAMIPFSGTSLLHAILGYYFYNKKFNSSQFKQRKGELITRDCS